MNNNIFDLIQNEEKISKLTEAANTKNKKIISESSTIADIEVSKYESILKQTLEKKDFSTTNFESEINRKLEKEKKEIYDCYSKKEAEMVELILNNIVKVSHEIPINLKDELFV